jgi:ActD protein
MYGLMAEFDTAEQLLSAARQVYAAGYRRIDAYAPFPVDGLGEMLGFRSNAIPLIGLSGGVLGALTGYGMQFWVHTTALPINVGGRPFNSWPAFVPVTFELAVLFSALAMLAGLFVLNGHPEPYHPVFNAPGFERASRDRFFLCIQADDARFDVVGTREFLSGLAAREVTDVPE